MSKDAILIVLGLVVAAMPFLGFPSTWETIILILIGLGIVVLAYLLRQEMLNNTRERTHTASDGYVENGVRTGSLSENSAHTSRDSHGTSTE